MSLVSQGQRSLSLLVPVVAAHPEDESIAASQDQDDQDQGQCGDKEGDGNVVKCVTLHLFCCHSVIGQVRCKPNGGRSYNSDIEL